MHTSSGAEICLRINPAPDLHSIDEHSRVLSPTGEVDSLAIVAPRRRGKTLTRRKYRQGHVYQKARKRDDDWLPKEPAYVQYWVDVPGKAEQVKRHVALGVCRTRTIAERVAAEKLEKLGINSTQTLIFVEGECETD